MNGNAVTGEVDQTANNHNGTYANSVGVTYGVQGAILEKDGAVQFDSLLSSAGYLDLGDIAAFSFTAAFSVELWFKSTQAYSGNVKSIVGKYIGARGWNVAYESGGIHFWGYTIADVAVFNANMPSNAAAAPLNDNAWHHVVATWDGTTNANGVKLYLDNVVVNATAVAGAVGQPVVNCTVNKPSAGSFQGVVDEVAFYDVVLTSVQVAAHYAQRLSDLASSGRVGDISSSSTLKTLNDPRLRTPILKRRK
jgi:hypothetical protein